MAKSGNKSGENRKGAGTGAGSKKTQFTSNRPQPPNAGRKKSILKHLEELTGDNYKPSLSKEDRLKIMESMLEKSQDELLEIGNDTTKPIYIRLIANGIRNEMKKGDLRILDTILDRIQGKAQQTQVHEGLINHSVVNIDLEGEALNEELRRRGLPTMILEE